MICCLNPDCQHPLNPDDKKNCQNCSTPLIALLRGHYRVIKPLSNEGGFGITYLAEDVDKLNELCVVKQLAPKVQEAWALKKAVQQFEEEAKRLQQLGEHPQIPHLLAYFEQDNFLYLVQQFIDGQNLHKELKQRGTYNEEEIRELLLDLLPVLKFIHKRGVIHRDIKPQNIIRRDKDKRLVLIDFGASKQLTATVQTKMGTTIGSHGYTPIEQMQDGEAYPGSDLFSLGATCFYLLTGIAPYKLWMQNGFGWVATWRQHLSNPNIQLGDILDKLLKINIQERYQSVDEVIAELTQQPLRSPSQSTIPSLIAALPEAQTLISPTPKKKLKKQSKKQLLVNAVIVLLGLSSVGLSQFVINKSSQPSQPTSKTSENADLPNSLKGHFSDVNSVAFSPDSKTLASGSDDNTIKIWDLATQKEIRTLKGHSQWIWTIAYSPDGKMLASGSPDKTIKLWNLATGEEIRTLKGNFDKVASVAFSPDSKMLASGSKDKTIKLWNVTTGKEILTLKGHLGGIASVAFSLDGTMLASGSWDKTIRLWNVTTGKEIRTLKGHSNIVMSVAFSPDGTNLASGSKDNTIKLWNLVTGEATRTLKQHSDKVNSVAFLPNTNNKTANGGITLASGSSDNTVKLWNLATGQEIRTLKVDSGYVYSVAISPDGQFLASGGTAGNTLKIWRISP